MPDGPSGSDRIKRSKPILVGGILAIATVGAIAAANKFLCFSDCYAIEPLSVVDSAPETVVGSFRMIEPKGIGGGISTDRLGGGCLAFRSPKNRTCTKATDCQLPNTGAPGLFGYCGPAKTCWIKALEAHCWKSAKPGLPPVLLVPNQAQQTGQGDLRLARVALGYPNAGAIQTQVRVIACLNGKFVKGEKPPCGGGKGQFDEKFGPIRNVTLPPNMPLCPPPGIRRPEGC